MPAQLQRTNWAFGWLSKRLMGRIDLPAYRQGAHTLDNWLVNTSGSLDYRGGTRHVRDLDGETQRVIPLRGGADPVLLTIAPNGISVRSGAHMSVRLAQAVADDLTAALWSVIPNQDDVEFTLWRGDAAPQQFRVGVGTVLAPLGNVPDGNSLSHGTYYGQRLVVGGGDDHRQTILGSRTPDPETGDPRYTDWEQKDTVEEINEDFQTAGGISAGATSVRVDKVDADGDNVVFAGEITIKDQTTFRFGGAGTEYTATKTITKGGSVSEDSIAIEFEPGATSDVSDNTQLHIIHTTYEILASHAFEWIIDSGNVSTRIRWLAVYRRTLVIGCDNGVAIARSLAPDGEPEIDWRPATGMARVMPAVWGDGIWAVTADRRKVVDALSGRDLCLYHEDLFRRDRVKEIAWQNDPVPRLWAVTDRGKLYSQTVHDPNRVQAWTPWKHPATIRSVCVTPGGDDGDVPWVVCEYADGTVTLETIAEPWDGDQGSRVYVDSAHRVSVGDSIPEYMRGPGLYVVRIEPDPDPLPADEADWPSNQPQQYSSVSSTATTVPAPPGHQPGEQVLIGHKIEADMLIPPIDESVDRRFPGSGLSTEIRITHLSVGAVRSHRVKAGPPDLDLVTFLTGTELEEESLERRTMKVKRSRGQPPLRVFKDTPTPCNLTHLVIDLE